MRTGMLFDRLGPRQRAVYEAIASYGAPPMDTEHMEIAEENGQVVLRFEARANSESGFDVAVVVLGDSYTIWGDGWHENHPLEDNFVRSAHSVVEQLVTLLNGRTKLLVSYAGKWPYKWEMLHNYEDDRWESLSVTGLIFYNYFGRRRLTEKRNRMLRPEANER